MIVYQPEQIDQAWPELAPHFAAHHAEVSVFDDRLPVVPDRGRYVDLEACGSLRLFTARRGPELVGYASFLLAPALHYAGQIHAYHDALYLIPSLRKSGYGTELIRYADAALMAEGVSMVFQHVTPRSDHSPILKRLGYVEVETVYARDLRAGA